jgi:hypothetical protein
MTGCGRTTRPRWHLSRFNNTPTTVTTGRREQPSLAVSAGGTKGLMQNSLSVLSSRSVTCMRHGKVGVASEGFE